MGGEWCRRRVGTHGGRNESVANVGCRREHRGERVFGGIGQIPGFNRRMQWMLECRGQHRAAQCGLRAGQRLRQEIGELLRARGRDWASVVVARMVSEVVLEQGQEQQGQQGIAENAAQGSGGRQKSQAQVEKGAQRRWWQEERWAKQAAEEAARRAKEMVQEARKQEGAGLGWDSMLPLPRAEVGVAKAKTQVTGHDAARREAELKEHVAAEAHRCYAEAAQAEDDVHVTGHEEGAAARGGDRKAPPDVCGAREEQRGSESGESQGRQGRGGQGAGSAAQESCEGSGSGSSSRAGGCSRHGGAGSSADCSPVAHHGGGDATQGGQGAEDLGAATGSGAGDGSSTAGGLQEQGGRKHMHGTGMGTLGLSKREGIRRDVRLRGERERIERSES